LKLRLFFLAIIVLGLAPGTWVRSAQTSYQDVFTFTSTPLQVDAWSSGGFTLKRAWRLDSPDANFGGFSALLYLGEDQFLAGSDRGYLLRFRLDKDGPTDSTLSRIGPKSARSKTEVDLESLMRDPETGQFWAGFERSNTIVRYASDDSEEARARPKQMQGWNDNTGPEAMTRLPDGRAIVIAEQRSGKADGAHEGLLFPGDPTQSQTAVRFTYMGDGGHRPTDIALAPDGRAVLVLRRFDPMGDPRLSILLAVADPADIRPDKVWPNQAVIPFPSSLPLDNFEGLALDGFGANAQGCRIWLLSDDNFSAMQDTLLLEFDWADCQSEQGTEKGAQAVPHTP